MLLSQGVPVVHTTSTHSLLLELSYVAHLTAGVSGKYHPAVCSGRKELTYSVGQLVDPATPTGEKDTYQSFP